MICKKCREPIKIGVNNGNSSYDCYDCANAESYVLAGNNKTYSDNIFKRTPSETKCKSCGHNQNRHQDRDCLQCEGICLARY